MRLSIRRCIPLFSICLSTLLFCFYALQPRVSRITRFEFLENAFHRTSGGFYEFHDDGTGGWLTRWFPELYGSNKAENRYHPKSRCPVYTYIDTTVHPRGSDEFEILQVWMRAFWSLGFNPVVLTDKDAQRHTDFNLIRNRGAGSTRTLDYGRWFVMANRGGLFVDYRNIPMPKRNDAQFAMLQTCHYGRLTLYEAAGDAIMHGTVEQYGELVRMIVHDPSCLDDVSEDSPLSSRFPQFFDVKPPLEGIVSYSRSVVTRYFPTIRPADLPSLINFHLHQHFLREHPIIIVLDPIDDSHRSLFHEKSMSVARSLAACPNTLPVATCPSEFSPCIECKPASVVRVGTLSNLQHNAYLIVTVPHPYSYLSYIHRKSSLDPQFVRETKREAWISFVTAEIVDRHSGGVERIQALKTFAQSDSAIIFTAQVPSGFWQIWEENDFSGLPFSLGFKLKHDSSSGNDKIIETDSLDTVLGTAKQHVQSESLDNDRDMVESWNLAWSEFWYFIRALQRRRTSEQLDLVGSFGFN